LGNTLNDLMAKLDATDADIARVTDEIDKVQDVIDRAEEAVLHKDKRPDEDGAGSPSKPAATGSEEAFPEKKMVNVKVSNFSPAKIAGLEVRCLRVGRKGGCVGTVVKIEMFSYLWYWHSDHFFFNFSTLCWHYVVLQKRVHCLDGG
jgi:hypothetical protein